MLLSYVLACWVVVCRTVYSGQIDSSIHVVFHIYEQAVMEESTGLFITSPCSLFIIYSSCLRPFCIFLYAYPLPHCAILPFSSCHHSSSLSSFPCPLRISLSSVGPLLAFPSIYLPVPPSVLHPLCISTPDSHVYQ